MTPKEFSLWAENKQLKMDNDILRKLKEEWKEQAVLLRGTLEAHRREGR